MCILNENLVQKAMFILSRLENSDNVYGIQDEDKILKLMEKYELLNSEFLNELQKA